MHLFVHISTLLDSAPLPWMAAAVELHCVVPIGDIIDVLLSAFVVVAYHWRVGWRVVAVVSTRSSSGECVGTTTALAMLLLLGPAQLRPSRHDQCLNAIVARSRDVGSQGRCCSCHCHCRCCECRRLVLQREGPFLLTSPLSKINEAWKTFLSMPARI